MTSQQAIAAVSTLHCRELTARHVQSGHPEERPPWGLPASRGLGTLDAPYLSTETATRSFREFQTQSATLPARRWWEAYLMRILYSIADVICKCLV